MLESKTNKSNTHILPLTPKWLKIPTMRPLIVKNSFHKAFGVLNIHQNSKKRVKYGNLSKALKPFHLLTHYDLSAKPRNSNASLKSGIIWNVGDAPVVSPAS